MKIKSLKCMQNIFSIKDAPSTILGSQHKIEYIKDMNVFLINGVTIIPMFRINEVVLEEELKLK